VWNEGLSIACDAVKTEMERTRIVKYFIDWITERELSRRPRFVKTVAGTNGCSSPRSLILIAMVDGSELLMACLA
jgi:hypothetical protein